MLITENDVLNSLLFTFHCANVRFDACMFGWFPIYRRQFMYPMDFEELRNTTMLEF